MSLHAVVDDVWPTIGIGGPLPISGRRRRSGGPVFFPKKRPLTLRAAPLCHVIFATLRAAMEASAPATVSKKCREEVSLSLALFDLYTLHSRLGIIYLGRQWPQSSAPLSRPIYSGQFSPNSSSISLRPSSADQLLTAHSTANALSNTSRNAV